MDLIHADLILHYIYARINVIPRRRKHVVQGLEISEKSESRKVECV